MGLVKLRDVASAVDTDEVVLLAAECDDGLLGLEEDSLAARSLVVEVNAVAERNDTLVLRGEMEGAAAESATKHRVLN